MLKNIAGLTVSVSLALAILVLASCTREDSEGVTGDGVEWLVSMEEALRQAGSKGRPIMIDVYADWCVWCKRLDSDTYSHKGVVAKAGEFVNLKLDADANRAIVTKYKVGGLPTILFLDQDGELIHRVIGYKPPDQFVAEMETALDAFRNGKG